MIDITSKDLNYSLQSVMILKLRLQIYDLTNQFIDEITGDVVSGSGNITADSDVRRTYSLEVIPNRESALIVEESGYIWLNKKVKIDLGVYNSAYKSQLKLYNEKIRNYRDIANNLSLGSPSDRELAILKRLGIDTSDYKVALTVLNNLINEKQYPEEIIWYPQGIYLFTDTSATYDATTNTLSISCSDLMAWLDGTRNGTMGQYTIECPAYKDLLTTSLITAAQTDGVDITNYNAVFQWCVTQKEYDYYATEIINQPAEVKNAIFQLITGTYDATQEVAYLKIVKAAYPHMEWVYDNEVRSLTSHYTYREYIIQTLGQLGRFTDYNIDEIGEFGAFQDYNDAWETYRETYPEWQYLPEDITFSAGTTILSIINEILSYVVGFEKYINEYGTFCVNRIPMCYSQDCILKDSYMQKILISESNSVSFSEVKNISNLWGQVLDADFFANSGVTLSGSTYTMTIQGYEDNYYNGDIVAITVPATNPDKAYINVNSFGAIPIYDGNTETTLSAGVLSANETYCFKIYKKRENGADIVRAYYLGQWQVHTMAVLVDSATGDIDDIYHTTSGTDVARYSLEYFQDVYGCKDIYMEVQPDSPYTVQKIGEITASYSGGEYDKLTDVNKALAQARYLLWTTATLTDQISITTRIVPFMDVNQKIEFYSHTFDLNASHQYIVKSLSHDCSAGTTSWTLQRFYPKYQPGVSTYNQNDDGYNYDGSN